MAYSDSEQMTALRYELLELDVALAEGERQGCGTMSYAAKDAARRAHPDNGGSEQEFRRIRNAYDEIVLGE